MNYCFNHYIMPGGVFTFPMFYTINFVHNVFADILGSTAFAPVKIDIQGNIKVFSFFYPTVVIKSLSPSRNMVSKIQSDIGYYLSFLCFCVFIRN